MSIATSALPRVWPRWLARPADSSAACVAILLVVCTALFFYGLDAEELWRTESLRAIIARQMLESGNWVVPRLYGEPLFTKPPGMYVAIALCSLPLGQVTDVTARLPSALAATGCVLLFWWYFRRHVGRIGALAAALILPMSPMWLDKASSAEIDTLQVFWVTASLVFFFRATDEATATSAGPWRWWLAALLCVAGGFLTKWTAPEFFYGTAIPLLWWRGRLSLLWSRQHLVSAALAGLVCVSWVGAAVSLEGWSVFWATVEREGGDRLIPQHGGRPYPWLATLLHPSKLFATTLPWSALALVSLRPGFYRLLDGRERRLFQALQCWVWPHLLFWSLPTEHTPRHSFPLFPGIAGLAALVWLLWYDGRLRWPAARLRPAQLLAATLTLWFILKIAFVHVVMADRCAEREARRKGSLIAALVPPGAMLYLFRLKDEGIMFYYGRPVLRLADPVGLPVVDGPAYCVLTVGEWQAWPGSRPAVVQHLTDEQGAPIVLARISEPHPGVGACP